MLRATPCPGLGSVFTSPASLLLVTQVLLLNFLLLLVEEALISQRAVTVAFIFLSLDLAHEVCAPYVFVD